MNKIILLLILIVLSGCNDNNKQSSLFHKSMMFLHNYTSEKQVKNNNEKRFNNNSDLNELVNLYDKTNLSNLSSEEKSFYNFIVKQLHKKESFVTIKRLSNEENQSRYVYSVENSNYLITLNVLVNSLFIDSFIIDYKLEIINKNNKNKNMSFSGGVNDDSNDLITLLIIEFNKVWNKQTGKVHDNESKMKSFLKN